MRTAFVALDLETTGLRAATDMIIEIGAVRVLADGSAEAEIFSTRVNPNRPIPEHVIALTGIRNEDVLNAPQLIDLLPQLKSFVGDLPIVGQNIGFDVGFLRQHGLPLVNPMIDTYELASVLLPNVPRYNLNALMQTLGLQVEGDFHSALTDAKASVMVYNALWERLIHDTPIAVLHEIVRLSERIDWLGKGVFAAALADRRAEPTAPLTISFRDPSLMPVPLALPADAIDASAWETSIRTATTEILAKHGVLVIDAPPDPLMQRSALAALVPALHTNGLRATIALSNAEQIEQVLTHYLPSIQADSGTALQIATLKPRDHYLCLRQIDGMRRRLPTSIEDLRILSKILYWASQGASGDQDDISLRGPEEYAAWRSLSAENDRCPTTRCEAEANGQCPLYRAQQFARRVPLVLTTHALLASDQTNETRLLPTAPIMLIEDGQRLEETITSTLSVRLDLPTVLRFLDTFGTLDSGLIGEVVAIAEGVLDTKRSERLISQLTPLISAVRETQGHVNTLYQALAEVVLVINQDRDETPLQARLNDQCREESVFHAVRAAWVSTNEFILGIAEAFTRLAGTVSKWQDLLIDQPDRVSLRQRTADSVARIQSGAERLQGMHRLLDGAVNTPVSNIVYWLEMFPDQTTPTLRTAPLRVTPILDMQVWPIAQTVIVNGSALRIGQTFDDIRDRLGIPATADELPIYIASEKASQTLVYLPDDLPDQQPDRNKYQRAVDRALIELATVTNGRLLVLFTGYGQMRQVAQAIAPRLALGKITLFNQADGISQEALIEQFINTEKAVLLGARHLWYEIDLPPAALAALVIVRLPFAPFNDPLVMARSEGFKNTFADYALPDALRRFRQGVDRLARIRTGERGFITVLDRRLTSKDYGQTFIDNLPPCTVKRGTTADLASSAGAWLTGST